MSREMTIMLGVIAEKRQSTSRWIKEAWMPVGVMIAPADLAAGDVLIEDARMTRYYMGRFELTCHAADTGSYVANFNSGAPALYVILRRDTEGTHPLPWFVHAVTASPDAAQDHEVGSEDIIERLPMPPEIERAILEFLDTWHVARKFANHQRDSIDPEAPKFDKEPIYLNRKRPDDGERDD